MSSGQKTLCTNSFTSLNSDLSLQFESLQFTMKEYKEDSPSSQSSLVFDTMLLVQISLRVWASCNVIQF